MFERDVGEGAFDDEPDEIERLCQEALALFEDGETGSAKERAMTAVALDDEHPFPMFVLGMIAEYEGDLASARDLADLALRTAATNADAIQLRVQVHLGEREFEEAEQLLRFGILHNPDDPVLHEGLSRVLLATGRNRDALTSAEIALRLDSASFGALAVRSATLDALDDRDALLASLRQSAQMHPDDPLALVELAAVEAERGHVQRSRTLVARARRLDPNNPQIREAQTLIGEVHAWPLLRPLPGLLRWLREFPGGLAGFLLGLLIAALPLQALTEASPAYALPAWGVIAGWCVVALYAWLGPPVLTHRLMRTSATLQEETFYDAVAQVDSGNFDPERAMDLAHSLLLCGRRAGAAEILRVAATVAPPATADALQAHAAELDRVRHRVGAITRRLPWLGRLAVASGLAVLVATPVLAAGGTASTWYFSGAAFLLSALAIVLAERAHVAALDGGLPEPAPVDRDHVLQDALGSGAPEA